MISKKLEQMAGKLSDTFNDKLYTTIFEVLLLHVQEVKEVLSDVYDNKLVNVVKNKQSKTRPEEYKDLYLERIDEFNFIEVSSEKMIFNTPDMKTFDFSGRLHILETILEGLIGQYVEVDADQYKTIYGKNAIPTNPVDSSVPKDERVYIVKYNSFIKSKEKELNTKFIKYPFSNSPPIDIFREADDYVSDNLSVWINEGIEKAKKSFVKEYRGL